MRRVLFYVDEIPIYGYAAMLYLGIVCGIYAQLYAATLAGLSPARILAATLLLLTSALAGARLLFVVTHWDVYRTQLRRIAKSHEGGASMYGGLLVALPLSPFVLGALEIPFGAFWDLASITMLVGMIFTRVGCLLNGCCSGRPSDSWFALHLPNHRGVWTRRVPTQLLEAGWGLVVLLGAIALWSHRPFDGALFLYSLAAYPLGRLLLERTREDQDRVRGVRLQGALSLVFVLVSLSAFAVGWFR